MRMLCRRAWYLSICEQRQSVYSVCYFGIYLYTSNERACTAHSILVLIYIQATTERVQRMLFWYLSIGKQRQSVYSACYFGIYLCSEQRKSMYSACFFAIYLYASNERVCAAHAIFVFIYMRATDEHVQLILFWHLSICERQKSMCSACYFGNYLYGSNQRAYAAHAILVYFYMRATKEHVQRTSFWYLSICEERKSLCSACYFGNYLYASNQRACAAHVILIFIHMRAKKERVQCMLFWYLSICD